MKIIIEVPNEQQAQQIEALLQDHSLTYQIEPASLPEESNSDELLALLDQYPLESDILDIIPDSVAWQRRIRKDRKLPFRP